MFSLVSTWVATLWCLVHRAAWCSGCPSLVGTGHLWSGSAAGGWLFLRCVRLSVAAATFFVRFALGRGSADGALAYASMSRPRRASVAIATSVVSCVSFSCAQVRLARCTTPRHPGETEESYGPGRPSWRSGQTPQVR